MNQKVIDFNKAQKTKQFPDLTAGDVVQVHKRIKEGDKERVQVFKGMIIAIKGGQSSSPMITVRRETQGTGVEITFPLYLPTIEKIDLLRHSKIRRSKLYYMRGLSGKAAKMKIRNLSTSEKDFATKLNEELKAKTKAEQQAKTEQK